MGSRGGRVTHKLSLNRTINQYQAFKKVDNFAHTFLNNLLCLSLGLYTHQHHPALVPLGLLGVRTSRRVWIPAEF